MARDVRYMILYPFRTISVYNFATPTCVQSRPIIANTCPRPSDLCSGLAHSIFDKQKIEPHLVMVPSISETTTRSVESQTNIRAVAATAPVADRENVIVFAPGRRS